MTKETLVDMVCTKCGSEDIVRDAWAEWDPIDQQWVLKSVFDHTYCDNCQEETSIEEVEIAVSNEVF